MGLSRMLQAPRLLEFPKPARQEDQNSIEKVDCPRCGSHNTKFCYYNNYNKSQPRHFCKSCKRHWTKGGTLRNVPVGGGRNKNKRIKITSKRGNEKAEKNPNLQKRNNFSDNPIDCSNISPFPESISMAEDSFYPRNHHHQDLKFPFQFSDSCSFDADPSCSFEASTVTYSFNGQITEDPRIADVGSYSWNWDDFDGLVSPDFNLSSP